MSSMITVSVMNAMADKYCIIIAWTIKNSTRDCQGVEPTLVIVKEPTSDVKKLRKL
jgi:hypothetical protein